MLKEKLLELETELSACRSCHFRTSAQAPVGWFGNPDSPLVIVGEGPGSVEDDYGCPLIGPSGQLLDKALWAAKMTRDRILTTNVVKCRPRNNKTPNIVEAEFCAQLWLARELEIIKPLVIVALGSVALHFLGSADLRITRDRGQWFKTKQRFDCIATYHPAYLLRLNGRELVRAKWDVFHDLEAARDKVMTAVPSYNLQSPEPTNLFSLFPKRG